MGKVLHPGVVGVLLGGNSKLPAGVLRNLVGAPLLDVERRIGYDEICLELGELVVQE